MFEPGDKIVHARHGAGVVIESRTITYEGKEREYFCIQMNDDRHTLMIPYDSINSDEIRPAMTDTDVIEEVLNGEPEELADNYRSRQASIREKLRTRNPRKLSQALRDLSWLERTHKLTNTDARLRERIVKSLARELALRPRMNISTARRRIQLIVEEAMEKHIENNPEAIES